MNQTRRQWAFYFKHSLRDLVRNGSRTGFALFCIATGVAAVVALRSLAMMIADELTTNLAEINRGDIQIAANRELDPDYVEENNQNDRVFSAIGEAALRQWAADEQVDIQFSSTSNFVQILPVNPDGSYRNPFSVVTLLIEPEKWAYYNVILTMDGQLISEVFAPGERTIVISRRAARDNGLSLGDPVLVGGQTEPFTIAAFIDDEVEGSVLLRNGPAGLLGFMYFPLDRAEEFGLTPLPDTAYVKLDLGRSVEAVDESLQARFGEGISRITVAELEQQNAETADLINDLILVMGLSSILIGGIGIINTMLVIVGRRTLEVAVLKTLGLKAWRVTILFLTEAALMGLIGSLLGVIAGIILSYLVRGVGEDVLQTSLSWRPYPEAWFSGLTLGLVVTVAFGFLPTLIAGQVRPAAVLRPNEIKLPTAGLSRTLLALGAIIIVFGLTLNVIVAGRLTLPPTLMLGLGGILIGLFGGVILANQGILKHIPAEPDPSVAQRGSRVFTGAITSLTLVGLFALDLFLTTPINRLIIYGVPVLLGISLFYGLDRFTRQNPGFAISIARLARQLLLFGGSAILGLVIGGGIFAIITTALGILYPGETRRTELLIGGIICLGLALVSGIGFRLRGRAAAGIVGMALIGGAVLGVLGSGMGELLRAIFENTTLWDGIETLSVGIIVVEIVTLALGGAYALMWCLVWVLGKIPTFGNVDIKLSVRNITTRKGRTASTMIGLIAGIGALALITLTTSAVTSLLEQQIQTNAGGNVFILASSPESNEAVKKRLETRLEGVKGFYQFTMYRARLTEVDGEIPDIDIFEAGDAATGNRNELGQVEGQPGIGLFFAAVDTTIEQPDYVMTAGRMFTAADADQPVMVIREPFPGSIFDQMGLQVGSVVTWLLRTTDGERIEINYTIIGVIDRDSENTAGNGDLQMPAGSIPPNVNAETFITVADIDELFLDDAMIEFAQIQNVFAIDSTFIVQLIQRLLDQLVAIPTLVAILSLLAGIAIIANTVALDTQERRRQIGVLKAVGLKGYRVLGQMMFENALIGLIAGLIGVGIGLVATILIGVLGEAEQVSQTLSLEPAVGLVFLAVVVSLAATLISAWTAASEKPLNVLRYE